MDLGKERLIGADMKHNSEKNPPGRVILCMNGGSSSFKFALYRMDEGSEHLIAEGMLDRIGLKSGRLRIANAGGDVLRQEECFAQGHRDAVLISLAAFETLRLPVPDAVGHRLVHGGPDHINPVVIDPGIIASLKKLIPFAPLHLPGEIMGIEAAAQRYPGVPQVACFDTGFHRRMPELAQRFPLARNLWNEGVRRYGFHGISYEYIVEKLGAEKSGRMIIAHLGNGASMAAVRDGMPLDTTMGFSPTGGFMMSSRSGDLDPGVLLYLMQEKGYDAPMIERLVNHEAGLLGVSGISPDMKTLLDKRDAEPDAGLAVDMFCYHLRKQIGALAAVLGGVDTLVFTGGIGERGAPVRSCVCAGLEYLGVRLDEGMNARHADTISASDSACSVRIVPAKEDLVIARHTSRLILQKAES